VFKGKVPGAVQVAVIVGEEWSMLTETNGVFEGEALISGKDVAVFAKFGDSDSNFQGLIQYQTTI